MFMRFLESVLEDNLEFPLTFDLNPCLFELFIERGHFFLRIA